MANTTQVILHHDIDNVGKSGELVKVRPGFARNFLFPRLLAVPASTAAINRIEHDRAVAKAKAEKARKEAQEAADQIGKVTVKIARAAGEDGKLFGAVTAKEIETAVKAAGIVIDRKKMSLGEPLRSLGVHVIPVKLLGDIVGSLKVEVVAQ